MNARGILIILCIACTLYTGFVYRFSDAKTGDIPAVAENGKLLWQEKNCQSCHQLYGLGGYMGPDLTNVAGKGPTYIRAFMQHGSTRMPDFHLSNQEIDALTAFLEWVDKSGQFKVSDTSVNWTGSYNLNP